MWNDWEFWVMRYFKGVRNLFFKRFIVLKFCILGKKKCFFESFTSLRVNSFINSLLFTANFLAWNYQEPLKLLVAWSRKTYRGSTCPDRHSMQSSSLTEFQWFGFCRQLSLQRKYILRLYISTFKRNLIFEFSLLISWSTCVYWSKIILITIEPNIALVSTKDWTAVYHWVILLNDPSVITVPTGRLP